MFCEEIIQHYVINWLTIVFTGSSKNLEIIAKTISYNKKYVRSKVVGLKNVLNNDNSLTLELLHWNVLFWKKLI